MGHLQKFDKTNRIYSSMSTKRPSRLCLVETKNLICWAGSPDSYVEIYLNCFATFWVLLLSLKKKLTKINQELLRLLTTETSPIVPIVVSIIVFTLEVVVVVAHFTVPQFQLQILWCDGFILVKSRCNNTPRRPKRAKCRRLPSCNHLPSLI